MPKNVREISESRPRFLIILMGIFLVSFSGLVLEITITRIFSTTIGYHWAFVAISVALFGWGLGGIFLHFVGQRLHLRVMDFSPISVLVFSLSMPIYVWTILQFPMSPSYINFYYAASIIPFFLGGLFMALLFKNFAHSANKLYLADLAGASFACLSVEPLLSLLGAENTALVLGVTASIAGVLVSLASRKRKLVAICFIGLAINSSIFLGNIQYSFISAHIGTDRSLGRRLVLNPELNIVSTRWNSFSRIDVVEGPLPEHELALIVIDADAGTPVIKWNGTTEGAYYLKSTIDFLPYYLVNQPKTLIIGSGGGKDVIVSLVGGSSETIAVELNPIIVQVVKGYGEKAGNVYNRENVEVIVDEGRSFISRSKDKYDLIVLKLVDSWAAIAAGGYALSENYLYTSEAFEQYFEHLTDNGILAMVRWHKDETPRLVSTAVNVLQAKGKSVQEAGRHIAIVYGQEQEPGFLSLFMMKKTPFSLTQARELRNRTLIPASDLQICYIPYLHALAPYSELFNGTISLNEFYDYYPYRIDPVTDDDPFYFNFERPIPKTLSGLIKLALLLTVFFIAIPWIIRRQRTAKLPKNTLSFVTYFSLLGVAFMLLEIALIQRFILFLGHPTRALSVILFSLLLSSGIGSFVSAWAQKTRPLKNVLLACTFIIIIITIYGLSLPSLFAFFLPEDIMARTVISVLLLFPLGFFMGIPFPTGIRFLTDSSDQSIPWMWGINGAMSVLGAVFATAIGIMWGFTYAMAIGALAYFIVFLCAWYFQTRKLI